MKKITAFTVILMFSLAGFSAQKTITNVGTTFSPASLTIEAGDNVTFVLESIHSVIEVSKATWDVNGTTPLPGGFTLPLGGGELTPAQLPVGSHWYVCGVHGPSGMKGVIIVSAVTAIAESQSGKNISIFPNPASDLITVNTTDNLFGLQYFLSDLNGRQMLAGKVNSSSFSLDIRHFDKGIYIFKVVGQERLPIKVIKN
jgi:plastocyanin